MQLCDFSVASGYVDHEIPMKPSSFHHGNSPNLNIPLNILVKTVPLIVSFTPNALGTRTLVQIL